MGSDSVRAVTISAIEYFSRIQISERDVSGTSESNYFVRIAEQSQLPRRPDEGASKYIKNT
jgi:hypothetical protein